MSGKRFKLRDEIEATLAGKRPDSAPAHKGLVRRGGAPGDVLGRDAFPLPTDDPLHDAHLQLQSLIDSLDARPEWDLSTPLKGLLDANPLPAAPLLRAALVRAAHIDRLIEQERRRPDGAPNPAWQGVHHIACEHEYRSVQFALQVLLKRRPTLSDDDLTALIVWLTHAGDAWWKFSSGGAGPAIIDALVRRRMDERSYTDALIPLYDDLMVRLESQPLRNHGTLPLADRLRRASQRTAFVRLERGEAWTDRALADLKEMDERAHPWYELLAHCQACNGSRPSRRWMNTARGLLEPIGDEAFIQRVTDWFPLVDKARTCQASLTDHAHRHMMHRIQNDHMDILKGLCWIAGAMEDDRLARAVADLALSCFRKEPGGPRGVRVGNAAILALGEMPGRIALPHLVMLGMRIRYRRGLDAVERALTAAGTREGLPRDEIEEMSVPAYAMEDVGRRTEQIGDHVAEITIGGAPGAAPARLAWINARGKRLTSVPAGIKREHPEDLKDLRGVTKDIIRMLAAQRERLDRLAFITDRSWAWSTWRERYLDHPLVGTLARRLVWIFDDGRSRVAGAWLADDADGPPHAQGRLVDVAGAPLRPDEDTTVVSLWRPIEPDEPPGSTDTRDDADAWRTFFEERRIRQPFKQAHREVYLLTDAERTTRTYSNRFAAHILRQHQFNALCLERQWRNQIRVAADTEYQPPHKLLPEHGLRAEFWIDAIAMDDDENSFSLIATDQIRFYRTDAAPNYTHAYGGGYTTRGQDEQTNWPLPLDQIPPRVFSEIMRDVDLFVGVTSIGADPRWADGGAEGRFREYWNHCSTGPLGENARVRRAFLERLLPRLSVGPSCTITDRHLVVIGKKHAYKIHLGSGAILIEPGGRYLCIVPDQSRAWGRSAERVFLPFEGDKMLAVILSKALMLANDDKITDPTILSQL